MILDGNSIVNRAFFGVRSLNAPDGTPTNAIYGFFSILSRQLKDFSPDALCVAFDLHAPTFRHRACETYKAGRRPMPEELCVQMPILKSLLAAMGIKIYEKEGYEADDILGTAARRCEEEGWECIIVTGDRDSLQLISEGSSVCLVKNNENILYTPELFFSEYGFEPAKMIDLKALMGDSSDNIPGVPGVGEKTALDLLRRYGSLENIYSKLPELEIKEGVRKKLEAGKESAEKSFWLATIFTEVPIEFSPGENLYSKDKRDPSLYSQLKALGLRKTIEQFGVQAGEELQADQAAGRSPQAAVDEGYEELQGITVTADLKGMIKQGFEGPAFDTTIAQYLLNPTAKSYEEEASAPQLRQRLRELNLLEVYEKIELPLCPVLAEMETNGILADRNALEAFSTDLASEIELLTKSIYFQAGREFNINSPKQLSEILFDELCLPDKKKGSTAADVLSELSPFNPIIDDVLEYRELTKLKSTYTDALQNYIAADGRIHTTFQQTVTATGRLSSTDPNLQNIPVRKELGSKLRKMFVAAPGNVLVDADYSQIELRLLAHISNDENMISAFLSGEDFHALTASKVFGIPLEYVSSAERSRAKAVNFGIIYGMSAFSLSKDLRVSVAEANSYMNSYFEKFSGVKKYMEDIVKFAEEKGYVTSLYGRRRDIPELKSSNRNTREFGKRVALNMPIQGTAADIMKLAMISVYNGLKKPGLHAKLLLQIHDELIVECPEEEKEEVCAIVKSCMESVGSFTVPLLAEAGFGKSWAEAH